MAETRGFVHRLKVTSPGILAWAYIGPSPDDTELFIILAPLALSAEDAAYRASMADALGIALAARTEVAVFHEEDRADITAVHMPPL